MNRVKMQTESGSVYSIDMANLTWERVNSRPIWGLGMRNSGRLARRPTLTIGAFAMLDDTVAGIIRTTRIVRLEDISTDEAVPA